MKRNHENRLYPLAFRLRESEREALKLLALRWGVPQVEVIRKLLAEAITHEVEKAQETPPRPWGGDSAPSKETGERVGENSNDKERGQ